METALSAISHMTVGQKAAAAVAILVLALALAVALTARALSLRTALLAWGAALAGLAAAALLTPIRTDELGPRADPAPDYAAAVARFEAAARSPEPLNPLCPSRLLVHGERTATAVVLLHGVSSCPQAFVDFAPQVFARGHNVIVMRMPQNGYADRGTDALSRLTATELRDFGDLGVDIAAGLGDEVVVFGISAGGTVAAWAGANRPEVSRAVIVAPFFGLATFGPRINGLLTRLMFLLPEVSMWKDPILRARWEGMPHAYARQSTRGTAQVMRLGQAVFADLRERAPAGRAAVLVTNAADRAVSSAVTDVFAKLWASWRAPLASYVFTADHRLGHELVDPMEPGAQPALTYPVLLDAIDAPWPEMAAPFVITLSSR